MDGRLSLAAIRCQVEEGEYLDQRFLKRVLWKKSAETCVEVISDDTKHKMSVQCSCVGVVIE